MARLSDLVIDLAAVLRMEATTINTYARHLREAGLLSQGGRGVNAAQVTPLDAARLLIAMMVDGHAKDAPQTVRDFGGALLFSAKEDEQPAELNMQTLLGLNLGCSLEQFIAAMINVWADDEKRAVIFDYSPEYLAAMTVDIDSVSVSASCYVKYGVYEFHSRQFVEASEGMERGDYAAGRPYTEMSDRYFRGLRRKTRISVGELHRVGELIGGHRDAGILPSEEEQLNDLLASIGKPAK
jgi:hypothetical protein